MTARELSTQSELLSLVTARIRDAPVGEAFYVDGAMDLGSVCRELESDAARLGFEGEVMKTVDQQLGAVARPARVHVVTALPKTRSGKMLRRALQAVCERRDPGDLTTMEDPAALKAIQSLFEVTA